MSEVVFLDEGDDVGTIQGKIARAGADRIVLVVPRKLQTLRNPVRLQLVIRHAQAAAKDLVLIAQDRRTRELAKAQGLIVRRSRWILRDQGRLERLFQGSPVNVERGLTHPPRQGRIPGVFLALFTLGLLAVPVLGGFFLLPTATVTLTPESQVIADTIVVTATRNLPGPQLDTSEVPAHILQVTLEETDRISTTGHLVHPESRATGQVTFMNKSGADLQVRKGTLLSTSSGQKFLTVDDVSLPAASWSTGKVGIIAADPGIQANVGALAINQIVDAELASRLTVLNENPTIGGTEKQAASVTAADRNRLKSSLIDKLKAEAAPALDGQRKETESIYPQTINLVVIEENYDHNVDDESESVSLRLKANVNGLAFENSQVHDLVTQIFERRLPGDLQTIPAGLKVQPAGAMNWDNDKVVFAVQAEAAVTAALDEGKIKQQLRGLKRDEAEAVLARSLRLAKEPRVEIEPSWVDSVPWIDWRIQLKVMPAS